MTSYSYSDIIGRGATATVRLAWPRWNPFREVAVKCVDAAYADDVASAPRVERERRMRITHPNLATPLATVDRGESTHLVLPLARFGSLEDAIGARSLPPESSCVRVIAHVLDGLAALHDEGFLHRDLKPANVLLSVHRGAVTAMVADFGASRHDNAPPLSTVGAPVGTLGFIAPEVLEGGEQTIRSDLWSVGAIAARMASALPGPTPELRAIAASLAAVDPTERPADARHAIELALSTDPPARVAASSFGDGTRRGRPYRPPAWMAWRRHRRRLTAACVGVGVIAGAVPVGASRLTDHDPSGTRVAGSSSSATAPDTSAVDLLSDSPCSSNTNLGGTTDTSTQTPMPIRVGVPNDRSNTLRPGITKEVWDTARAFTAWCNAAGGIRGRPIELVDLDARLGNSPVPKGCRDVAATVGGGWLTAPELPQECPSVNVPAFRSPPGANDPATTADARTVFGPPRYLLPNWLRDLDDLFPGALKRPIVVSTGFTPVAVATAIEVLKRTTDQLAPAILVDPDDATSIAMLEETIARTQPTSIWFIGESSWIAGVREQVSTVPAAIFTEGIGYDLDATGGGATDGLEGLVVASTQHPLSEADRWPGVQRMLDVIHQFGDADSTVGSMSALAWSAWMLFATTATQCESFDDAAIRECLLATRETMSGWTGGGLHAPVRDPQTGFGQCWNLFRFLDRRWARISPSASDGTTEDDFTCAED